MIASFTNNFIFLRTRKTGGTSVEVVLSSWCSPPDICTRINKDEEPFRRKFGGLRPKRSHNGKRVYHHMPASEVRDIFPELWNKAFKFAIERHPYEKVVSRVFWNIAKRNGDAESEFDKELQAVLESDIFIDRSVYCINGIIVADRIVKFDEFWPWLGQFGEKLGRTLPAELPKLKASHRKDCRPGREILSANQRLAIQKAACFEFDNFGFRR